MNIASVSWGDHLTFGDGDGRLETPDALARRLDAWRTDLGAGALHWRMLRTRIPGRFSAARGYRHPSEVAAARIRWDDFEVVPRLARDAGLEPWLYVSVFDEGFPLASPRERRTSHHNAMHGRHVAWQSDLTRLHPEWVMVDRTGRVRQQGVVCLAYAGARRAFADRWMTLLDGTGFRGLFLCLRSQSRPAGHADQFGFNEPVRADFQSRFGCDILHQDFDVQAWRDLVGSYLTTLLCELQQALRASGRRLAVGIPRGDVLGPPLGNTTLAWREWIGRGLVDALVVGQSSSQCPSMWHQLWPMHRGYGHLQDYLSGRNLPPLTQYCAAVSAASGDDSAHRTTLYIARQWSERTSEGERGLLATPGVAGLVFSSFRHDNPAAVARGDWRVAPDGTHVPATHVDGATKNTR
ncbi:MAG: hypothetical protein ACRD26_09760 [Vicinamibacterales bacterium]